MFHGFRSNIYNMIRVALTYLVVDGHFRESETDVTQTTLSTQPVNCEFQQRYTHIDGVVSGRGSTGRVEFTAQSYPALRASLSQDSA